MHELSIVLSIVDIAEKEVKKHEADSVERIELDIGKLSGIEPHALEFAWEYGVNDSVLAHAEKVINYIPGKAICMDCGHEFEVEQVYDECPKCKSYMKDFRSGRELHVRSLTLK